MNEVFYSSIFGELTKQVQIRIDAASELRKRLSTKIFTSDSSTGTPPPSD